MKIENNIIFSRKDRLEIKGERCKRVILRHTKHFLAIQQLELFRKVSFFLLSSCDPTRFSSLRLLELGNSQTALAAEAFTC